MCLKCIFQLLYLDEFTDDVIDYLTIKPYKISFPAPQTKSETA